MQDVYTYQVGVQGQIDEKTINATSPLHMTVERVNVQLTRLTIYADQAGLIGALRYLHQQGYLLLSVNRIRPIPHEKENSHDENRDCLFS